MWTGLLAKEGVGGGQAWRVLGVEAGLIYVAMLRQI